MNRHYTLSTLSKVTVQFVLLVLFALGANGQSQAPPDSLDPIALEQKIGQMIMVGIRGTHLNADAMEMTRSQILNGGIGGIIFFKHNIKNSRQFRIFVKSLKALPVDQPLLLAVDEEGGLVRRLRKNQGFDEFPSAAHVGANLSTDESYDLYSRMADQIHQAGLNLNLAPVVDVNINRISPAIGQLNRSFSRNPGDVFDYSEAFIRAHNDAGVLSTLKHYPGHGSSREDSHNGITDITSTWRSSEQVPFQRLIDSAKVDMIMAGHLMDKGVDSKYPASISNSHIQITLRGEMGFTGVVITDDLQMGAVIKRFELEEIVIAAVNAGCDILQFSDPLDLDENLSQRIKEIILQAIESGQVDPQRIHESYARIIDLKSRLSPSLNPTSD
ncbi:MAG: glycoside hydrolase family 3 protein [Candidatus Marinimicrobia bacterium]|jgi:beta-N-acetylhexosaminidase|nr:glycoside hydrolase family 3 protein [Candidatus Neomarinimicrobiota bacterium]